MDESRWDPAWQQALSLERSSEQGSAGNAVNDTWASDGDTGDTCPNSDPAYIKPGKFDEPHRTGDDISALGCAPHTDLFGPFLFQARGLVAIREQQCIDQASANDAGPPGLTLAKSTEPVRMSDDVSFFGLHSLHWRAMVHVACCARLASKQQDFARTSTTLNHASCQKNAPVHA